jgi:hypothetical protein
MNTWQAIALVCIGIGAACVVVERAFRDTPRDRLVDPVLFAVTMLILAPFLLAYLLALVVSQPLVTLWRGKIPFTDKPWWPERAKMFEPPAVKQFDMQSDNSTLCK